MRAPKLFAFLAAASSLVTAGDPGGVTLMLFQDNECRIPIPGNPNTTVWISTCDSNPATGWSSAMIVGEVERCNCMLTMFTHNYRAGPGEYKYSLGLLTPGYCFGNWGFVANAVGLRLKLWIDQTIPEIFH
ncbi:hypothetical protein F5Y16DRAFT_403413 [Xylariaceae sp. FL0255]|nr:hypothetical protein F5Y16DRAFT_403413 [Xylariaceae sp. FL0255]